MTYSPDITPAKNFVGKRVLITGGLGFIGSNLAIRLIRYGSEVTLYTRSLQKLRNVKEIEAQARILVGDMTNEERVRELVHGVDYIFHLAAQTSNIVSMENPLLDLDSNLKGSLILLEACRHNNPKAPIISVGTVTQIGKPHRLPVDESHLDNPLTVYDADKLACEKYFNLYNSAFGLQTTFLRLSTIYGERQTVTSNRVGIINYFIRMALQGEVIKIFGVGKFLRDYVYVQDLVDALLLCATTEKSAGQSFVVATGSGTEFVEMAQTVIDSVKQVTGKEARYEHVPWPSDWKTVDVGSFVGSPKKLEEFTGWLPRTTLRQGITNTVAFYAQRLKEYL